MTGVREEGSYDVDYGCGETERSVPPPLVRTPQAPTSPQRAAAGSAARRANETEAERAARKAEKRRRRAEKERLRQQRGDASFPAAEGDGAAPAGDVIEGMTHRAAVDRVRELERVCKRAEEDQQAGAHHRVAAGKGGGGSRRPSCRARSSARSRRPERPESVGGDPARLGRGPPPRRGPSGQGPSRAVGGGCPRRKEQVLSGAASAPSIDARVTAGSNGTVLAAQLVQ